MEKNKCPKCKREWLVSPWDKKLAPDCGCLKDKDIPQKPKKEKLDD